MLETIEVGISNRHVHLTEEDARTLFGRFDMPKPERWLGIGDNYASSKTLHANSYNGAARCRVLLPYRAQSFVELLFSDCLAMGLKAVFGHCITERTDWPEVVLLGPKQTLTVPVMVARPHVHAPDAWRPGIDSVLITADTPRPKRFWARIKRTPEAPTPVLHIDIDEAMSIGLARGDGSKIYVESPCP